MLCKHEIDTTDSTKGEGCSLTRLIEQRDWVSGLIPWQLKNKQKLSTEAKANKERAFNIDVTLHVDMISEQEKLDTKKTNYNALPFYGCLVTLYPTDP